MSSSIPLDIVLEIMKRLPVKSLIRFISACKAWKSLIQCSEFVAGYIVPPTQPHHLLVHYLVDRYGVGDPQETNEVKTICFVDDDTFPQQKFALTIPPLLQLLDRSRVVGSSCGLFCLSGLFREPDNSNTEMAVLWNPSIRKSIAFSVPNLVHESFDYVTGFGVCPHTNDPKLVKITYINEPWKAESTNPQVMVFTLSSGEWRTPCSNMPRKSIQLVRDQTTAIGQFIYWLANDLIDHVDDAPRNLIMSFDLSTDEFREVHLPDSLHVSEIYISRLRESIVLLEYNKYCITGKYVFNVWMMEHGDQKAFTKQFTIKAPDASIWPVGFRKSGEALVEMKRDHTALVVYEPCSEHIKDLGIYGNGIYSVYSYTESLLLLDHDDGHIVSLRCVDVKR